MSTPPFSLPRQKKKGSSQFFIVCFTFTLLGFGVMFLMGGSYYLSQSETAGQNKKRNGGGGSSSGSILVRRPLDKFVARSPTIASLTKLIEHGNLETTTNEDKDTPHAKMPQWIRDYVAWHHEMRLKYPGASLFTDPDSPGVLLRWCGGLCGGLHDRVGQLPLDLFVANQTRRVLLIKWEKPHPLELFMEPPLLSSENDELSIDWTFPNDVPMWSYQKSPGVPEMKVVAKNNIDYSKSLPSIANTGEDRGELTVEGVVSEGIEKFSPGGTSASEKIVMLKVMGHLEEEYLEGQLQNLGQTDMIHSTSTFGLIWHMFFQLAKPIQKQLDHIMKEELFLVKRQYTAVHCRVLHPKAFKAGSGSMLDKTGLPFHAGPVRDMAVETAIHALKCAATQSSPAQKATGSQPRVNKDEAYYFMSDSNDLVEFMVRDVKDDKYMTKHPSMDFVGETSIYAQARQLANTLNIKSRDNSAINAHIDKMKGKPLEDYYSVFLDLHLAMQARCISFGIGFYAVFAAKIGGIVDCKVQYTKEKWGGVPSNAKTNTEMCTPDLYKGLF
jgi:hypothetical protein